MHGRLIVLDGLDGSGKRTQTQLLADRLTAQGKRVLSISFPDYANASSALVKQYLAGEFGQAQEVSPYAASSFYSVDRYASYQTKWKKAYEDGYTILADRYVTSNLIHQMPKLPREEWDNFVCWLEDFEYVRLGLPRPDAVLYLDMPPAVSATLLMQRYGGDATRRDIHEANRDYLEQCHEGALYAAERCGWHIISCATDACAYEIDQIATQIYDIAIGLCD